ncbi:MAG: anaerobic ribonucleoside-triphosphate reductase activating protein [Anaerolineae bacterium]|nr:anaerobic ribonucleoside-triphosphate reductase activating protein [Anaerolineae bacterium]
MLIIAGLQRVSLIDYPDRIAASVFLAGCNLDCAYCHNRWMIREADVVPALSAEELLGWLGTRVGLLDGVCISGGEPTLQPELDGLLRAIKALGFEVKLDTNGLLPQRLDRLLDQELVDYVAMDIKAPLDARYAEVAGCPIKLESVRESMRLLRQYARAYEFRTTVGPQIDEQALVDIASVLIAADPWFLQVYRQAPGIPEPLRDLPALGADELQRIAERLRQWTPNVQVRGA